MALPIVSIVSGTYNRLSSVTLMVQSVRQSVGVGIPYEIVLVDGGSTDGTIQWAKMQPDILLIEQGKLLGAVKAFNEGAMRAHGTYVILANDDIIFIDESIRAAIAYMQDNPDCGVGCFYQDRDGLDWHVSGMPAVKDGKQVSAYYGQVCIVPKWLGVRVGWWGDYLHTYAGDNELSCNVLEMGYKVDALPRSSIHDCKVEDGLRDINSKLDSKGQHPDSMAWAKKWRHQDGTFGPILVDRPKIENPIKRTMRILHAPIYDGGFRQIQAKTRHGMRDALAERFMLTEVDYLKEPMLLFDVADAWDPDIILTQLQGIEPYGVSKIKQLKAEHPNTILVNWNGDYFPSQFFNTPYMEMMKLFDYCGFVSTTMMKRYTLAGIHYFYWQIGFEPSSTIENGAAPKHDVVFLGNYHQADPVREQVGRLVNRLRDTYNTGLYGRWPREFNESGFNLYDFEAGQRIYHNCKIAISDWRQGANAWVSNRFFEAMGNGAFVLQQFVPELDEMNGCVEGEHYISWSDIVDLEGKIKYWLAHDDARMEIAKAGQAWAIQNCTFRHRVQELCDVLSI